MVLILLVYMRPQIVFPILLHFGWTNFSWCIYRTLCLCLDLPPDVNQIHQPLLVCTAHIHWDPEFCDVKLIQVMMLSHALKGILEESSMQFRPNTNPTPVQLLLCGDFNSLPDSGKCNLHIVWRKYD